MNSSENWVLIADKDVFKVLKRFPRKDAEAIVRVFDLMSQNPFDGDIEKMKGKEYLWRRRVGSYRIFYELRVDIREINVIEVKRRTSNTY